MDSCENAIAAVFGLNNCEKSVLSLLCRKKADVAALAPACKKSAPRIAQVLSRLRTLGLVSRQKVPLSRGYKYVFSSMGKKRLAELAKQKLYAEKREIAKALGA